MGSAAADLQAHSVIHRAVKDNGVGGSRHGEQLLSASLGTWNWSGAVFTALSTCPHRALTEEHDSVLYLEAFITQPRAIKLRFFLGESY